VSSRKLETVVYGAAGVSQIMPSGVSLGKRKTKRRGRTLPEHEITLPDGRTQNRSEEAIASRKPRSRGFHVVSLAQPFYGWVAHKTKTTAWKKPLPQVLKDEIMGSNTARSLDSTADDWRPSGRRLSDLYDRGDRDWRSRRFDLFTREGRRNRLSGVSGFGGADQCPPLTHSQF
jgi:hypothetical protein